MAWPWPTGKQIAAYLPLATEAVAMQQINDSSDGRRKSKRLQLVHLDRGEAAGC